MGDFGPRVGTGVHPISIGPDPVLVDAEVHEPGARRLGDCREPCPAVDAGHRPGLQPPPEAGHRLRELHRPLRGVDVVHEAHHGSTLPDRSEERDPVLDVDDDIGAAEVASVGQRRAHILAVGPTGRDDGVVALLDGASAQQRHRMSPRLKPRREVIDDDLGPTRLRVGEIAPGHEHDAHRGLPARDRRAHLGVSTVRDPVVGVPVAAIAAGVRFARTILTTVTMLIAVRIASAGSAPARMRVLPYPIIVTIVATTHGASSTQTGGGGAT